jgi:hypothetical protein
LIITEKYKIVKICPVIINGSSTGSAPIHVNKKKILISIQNRFCLIKLNCLPCLILFFFNKGKKNKIKIDINKAITPPNLFGIERKIA